jgi:predicted dehydrogenase
VETTTTTRRGFLATGAAAAAATIIPTAVHASADETIKVGVIGCGGRGSGACRNALDADKAVKIVACGDAFPDKVAGLKNSLKKYGTRVDLGDRMFSGLDAYEKVLKCDLDYVILATPPGFRPVHLKAAVEAKKNVFCEKPVAVDAPGIRTCLSLVDQINANKTALVAGTQRRHQAGYLETIKRIHDGEIGDVVAARCSWNGDGIWFHPRESGTPDVAYQLNNWYHFLWLCGDHIVEQHVHNLDVINWVLRGHPVKAVGFGGRTYGNKSRPVGDPKEVGNIWDHFAVEFEYPNGVHVASYCTQITGVKSDVSETVFGSKAQSRVSSYMIGKKKVAEQDPVDPYVQEHVDLIKSIRAGKPLNELQSVTESTMTAILGRTAAYTGKEVKWDDMLKSHIDTMPNPLSMTMALDVPPVPMPGKAKV